MKRTTQGALAALMINAGLPALVAPFIVQGIQALGLNSLFPFLDEWISNLSDTQLFLIVLGLLLILSIAWGLLKRILMIVISFSLVALVYIWIEENNPELLVPVHNFWASFMPNLIFYS